MWWHLVKYSEILWIYNEHQSSKSGQLRLMSKRSMTPSVLAKVQTPMAHNQDLISVLFVPKDWHVQSRFRVSYSFLMFPFLCSLTFNKDPGFLLPFPPETWKAGLKVTPIWEGVNLATPLDQPLKEGSLSPSCRTPSWQACKCDPWHPHPRIGCRM